MARGTGNATALRITAGVLTALVLAACSGTETVPTPPTPTSDPPPTTTPTPTPSPSEPDDPFAIPDEITPAYVDLVVNTLYEEWGDIIRTVLSHDPDPDGPFDPALQRRMEAIFADEHLHQRLDEATTLWRGERRTGYLDPSDFGQLTFAPRQVTHGDPTCIVAVGDLNTEQTAHSPGSVLAATSLVPSGGHNPTHWRIIDLLLNTRDGASLPDELMLEASLEDFEGFLTTSCTEVSS